MKQDTPDILIRLALEAEQKPLEALQLRSSLENAGDRAFLMANPEVIQLPLQQIRDCLVFVAELNGTVVGFVALKVYAPRKMELEGLFIEPGHWRLGTGRRLVAHAIEVSRAQGARTMLVFANPHADGFYRRVGFIKEGEITVESQTAIVMSLDLRRR
jgi:N-acetylglutamate synthase-like GNAT family acetyltransferase